MDLLGRSWKIGVCPICQRQGIGWCTGGIGDAHDTASIEVVEVIPASQLAGAVEAGVQQAIDYLRGSGSGAFRSAASALEDARRHGQVGGQ